MWRGLICVIGLVAPLLTSACTVPVHGMAGIGVDADGRIVGYLRVCSHHIDGATLYHDEEDVGRWTAPQPVTDFVSWTLASPPSGWKTALPLAQLRPATEYTFFGGTSDNSSSTVDVTFSVEQVAKLQPDQVLHWSGNTSGDEVYKVESVQEFRRSVCGRELR